VPPLDSPPSLNSLHLDQHTLMILLVLDNCEHLIAGCTHFTKRYLISSSKLAFSVVKGVVPEMTRIAVLRFSRLSVSLP
jgi:hypothetical protein